MLEKAEKHQILCESLKKNATFAEYRALFRKTSLNLQVEIKGNSMGADYCWHIQSCHRNT